jgi:predicted metal-dependent hydrolase
MTKVYIKDNKKINYQINKKNNKHTYIKIRDNIVIFNAAKAAKENLILKYLEKNFDILYNNINKRIETENTITLWDKVYPVVKSKYITNYEFNEDVFYINENKDLKTIKKIIYYDALNIKLLEILPEIEKRITNNGLNLTTYKLKFLISKFGSFHRVKQEITLNTYLAKLDEKFLKYVIYHEYAHQKVFNHSKAFYDFLKQLKPNYKEYDKAMKNIAIYI